MRKNYLVTIPGDIYDWLKENKFKEEWFDDSTPEDNGCWFTRIFPKRKSGLQFHIEVDLDYGIILSVYVYEAQDTSGTPQYETFKKYKKVTIKNLNEALKHVTNP